MVKNEKKLAILTPEEDRVWNKNIEFYIEEGFIDDDASENAWKDLQAEFPRLKKYNGAK